MGAFDDLIPKKSGSGAFGDLEPQVQVRPLSRTDKFVKGLRDPVDGGAQLLTNILPDGVVQAGNRLNNWLADKTGLVGRLPEGGVDQQVRQNEAAYQKSRAAQGEDGFDGYRVLGNFASPVNYVGGSVASAATTLPARMGVGAAVGGLNAAFSPVANGDFADEKLKQLAGGALTGAAFPVVANAVSRLVNPKMASDPHLALLRSEGVQPTVGQTLGGKWNALEEKAQSLPIVGDAIASARTRAVNQFNNAAINRSLTPIGQKVEGAGQAAVRDAGDVISDAYTAAKNQLGGFQVDQQGSAELARLQNLAANLPARERKTFESLWQTMQGEMSPNGSFLADSFKRLDSKLVTEAGRFSGASDAYQQQLGDAVKEMQRILFENAKRANPQAGRALSAADAAYANLVRVEGASKAAMNNGGVFTPGQLNMAVRQADNSVRDRATARGLALMQDLSNAGQAVIGNKVPNSFTTDRALIAGGTLGGGFLLTPAVPLGLAAGAAAYSKPVQGLLGSVLSSRPQAAKPVADALEKYSARLLPLSTQVALGLLN